MRRLLVAPVAVAAALALEVAPASAAGGAVANCGLPPGQIVSDFAKVKGTPTPVNFPGGAPGQLVKDLCAPGGLKHYRGATSSR